jgi:DNA invertase Pin-like site-specific DNA recombinase
MRVLTKEDYEIAEKNGVSYMAAYHRFYTHNWSREDTITKPTGTRGRKPSEGFKRWEKECKENNISSNLFRTRIRRGMTEEKAATKPVTSQQKKKVTHSLTEDEYWKLKSEGKTDSIIASELGCSVSTLHYWKKDNNIENSQIRHTVIPESFTPKDYLHMKKEGYKDELIAMKLGCCNFTLTLWKRKHNLKGRSLRKSPNKVDVRFKPGHYLTLKSHMIKDDDISDMLNVSVRTFKYWKKDNQLGHVRLKRSAFHDPFIPATFTKDDYLALKEKGVTDEEMADKYLYVGNTCLYRWKQKQGLTNSVPQVRPKKIQNPRFVIAGYENGVTQRKLAERFGVGKTTIYRIIKDHKEGANDNYISV